MFVNFWLTGFPAAGGSRAPGWLLSVLLVFTAHSDPAAATRGSDSSQHAGFAPCWNRTDGFHYVDCCVGHGDPRCFDAVFTPERCCSEADNDPKCWDFARLNIATAIRSVAPAAALPGGAGLRPHLDALEHYRQDDALLAIFCCVGAHNEYCWGSAVPEVLLTDLDSWDGKADVTSWYARCCFPRLKAFLRAPVPRWMQRQIDRDLGALAGPGRPGFSWPSKAAIVAFTRGHELTDRRRFCDFHLSAGEVRHCNFTERGYDPRLDIRVRIFVRALRVLAELGELPATPVSFAFSFADIEWDDLPLPVVTFQRSKAARRLVRVPMWEQLDGSWSRKVEQLVLSHESGRPFAAKAGSYAFWRGTDSAVPAGDCFPRVHKTCKVTEDTVDMFHRLRLAKLSNLNPKRINAKLSGVKPRAVALGLDKLYRRLRLLERRPRDWPIEAQLRFRYLLDVDGSSQSTRLYWSLLSNSVVLKQATPSCNWYSDRLKSNTHIFPVRRDLADLALQVGRLRQRPHLARHIARRSSSLARAWLSHEDSMHYLARVLAALAKAQAAS